MHWIESNLATKKKKSWWVTDIEIYPWIEEGENKTKMEMGNPIWAGDNKRDNGTLGPSWIGLCMSFSSL